MSVVDRRKEGSGGRYIQKLDRWVVQDEVKDTIRCDPEMVYEFTARCAVKKWGEPPCEWFILPNGCLKTRDACGINGCAGVCVLLEKSGVDD